MYEPEYLHYLCDEVGPTVTLINLDNDGHDCRILPWYVANVWNGIQPWGEEFSNKFLESGGMKPSMTA